MSRARYAWGLAVAALLLTVIVTVTGCLPFPLGNPTQSKVDPKLAGHWFFDDADHPTVVTVFPFDAHAYVVESRDCKKDGGKLEVQNRSVWKGWLTEVSGKTFLTLDSLAQHLECKRSADHV